MITNLKDRAALVTGGANGVGREICLSLAAEGAAIAVNYRSSRDEAETLAEEIRSNGGKAIAVGADVADLDAVRSMVDRVGSEFGRLDVLVNNAGIAIRNRFTDTTPDEWRRQIDACLYGMIHCCHASAPLLERGGAGRIIGVVGDSSRVGESGLSIVAAARAGMIGLAKSLAREMGRSGVTANIVSLGLIETAHDREWVEENRAKLVKLYPTRRLGQPSDIAPIVTTLASDGGAWITGQVISVSGGFSMVG